MARKTVLEWVDDIDGTSASETVTFSIDGSRYEIDLSAANAENLRAVLAGWIEASRRSTGRRSHGARASEDPAESGRARKWAIDNGFDVSPRGRLRTEILEAFRSRTSDT